MSCQFCKNVPCECACEPLGYVQYPETAAGPWPRVVIEIQLPVQNIQVGYKQLNEVQPVQPPAGNAAAPPAE